MLKMSLLTHPAQLCLSHPLLPGRFLRDYDGLFPVADDISLLQQASSLLYPLTVALTWQVRGGWFDWDLEE